MTTGLDTGTYEVLRDRLTAQAAELARRTEELNARRSEEFGSTRLELAATERLRTEHTVVPRDIVAVGDMLLFGYNAVPSREADTSVGDVLALHDRNLERLPDDAVPGLLDDPAFVREFAALQRYYRQARLLQLRRINGKLLAVFQTGEKADDTRVLRWALSGDGRATFLDARGDRDHVLPPSHDIQRTTSLAATRTSPSAASSSSPRSAAPSPSRSTTTPRQARASTPNRSTSHCSPSRTPSSRTRAWAP
jgi:hypothetical protein